MVRHEDHCHGDRVLNEYTISKILCDAARRSLSRWPLLERVHDLENHV